VIGQKSVPPVAGYPNARGNARDIPSEADKGEGPNTEQGRSLNEFS